MLNLARHMNRADRDLRQGVWKRRMGIRLANATIGIIGAGRIGTRVIRHLSGFAPKKILVNDVIDISALCAQTGCVQATKEEIYRQADIISLHVPLTKETYSLVGTEQFAMMKPSAMVINTARGGIVNEAELHQALEQQTIAAAACDVFEQEPYDGPLASLENSSLTNHLGSCTTDCRFAMELEAVEEGLRHVRGEPLVNEVPDSEYQNREA